ncbi:MAG: hypothetical protein JW729_01275 [Bacteroidales bacterium]|nr:hypothetical protein [Bacteroidales bacterium]
MDKKLASVFSVVILLLFVVFIIYDVSNGLPEDTNEKAAEEIVQEQRWEIDQALLIPFGRLKAVASNQYVIIVGGEHFLAAYDTRELALLWNIQTDHSIYALAVSGNRIYASTGETILIYTLKGDIEEEWGPFDEKSQITSISANEHYIAFADASNKLVFILNQDGSLFTFFGKPGNQFIVPSPYFDVAFLDNEILGVANPGKRQIEYRTLQGDKVSFFGEEGVGLKAFCGCCNPAHFAFFPDGKIVTAEKGINRLKILNQNGELIELVSQSSLFKASVPLDLAVGNETIYAANGADSKLYIFKRKG